MNGSSQITRPCGLLFFEDLWSCLMLESWFSPLLAFKASLSWLHGALCQFFLAKLNFDGGSFGNLGITGFGVLLRRDMGAWIVDFSGHLP